MKYLISSILIHLAMILIFAGFSLKVEKDKNINTDLEIVMSMEPILETKTTKVNNNQQNKSKPKEQKDKKTKQQKKIKKKIIKKEIDKVKPKEVTNIKKEEPKKLEKIKKIEDVEDIAQNLKEEKTIESEAKVEETLINNNENIILKNGRKILKHQRVKGIKYKIIKNPDPKYPDVAKKFRLNKPIKIKVRFLVDLNGKIKDIKFYSQTKYPGFDKEVVLALKNWEFSPVTLNGEKIEMHFYKIFIFEIK